MSNLKSSSGLVQQLNNYYQKHGVNTNCISYSHRLIPGIGYTATVTLSNFNPSGTYTGTGGSIQAAKEAAARVALQALGQVPA
ncbi:hypothetical protein EXIGLDRAFT_730737 [Exidia glandulosa HHB12029]|uniref:DRBM domain-containing protein n=1 Tax=Exidia glandulosa HHB12029 TaxID=1314781 RepID=A0A165C338_EXIGL|nr:hypothetical protein EXIGLDRAFT_730737 [Exidia glandulosa HHB12029]